MFVLMLFDKMGERSNLSCSPTIGLSSGGADEIDLRWWSYIDR